MTGKSFAYLDNQDKHLMICMKNLRSCFNIKNSISYGHYCLWIKIASDEDKDIDFRSILNFIFGIKDSHDVHSNCWRRRRNPPSRFTSRFFSLENGHHFLGSWLCFQFSLFSSTWYLHIYELSSLNFLSLSCVIWYGVIIIEWPCHTLVWRVILNCKFIFVNQ
jgi:hypothetical protein